MGSRLVASSPPSHTACKHVRTARVVAELSPAPAGEGAPQLLLEAALDPATHSLADLAQRQQGFRSGDTLVSFVSSQMHLLGRQPVTSYLFQRIAPEAVLTAEEVSRLCRTFCPAAQGRYCLHLMLQLAVARCP